MNKSIKLIIIFLSINSIVFGQNTMTLEEVINSYFERTNAAKINTIDKNIATSNFLLYKAGMKPQVSLNFQVPNYSKTSVQIVQPNGSIAFQSISQNNSLVGLQLLQAIPWTGGTFFAQSELRRFDDFSTDFNSYNGIPIRLGINIPVLGFNPYKWDKLIQPLELNAAISTYKFETENIKSNIVQLYFDVLIAQTAKQIAVTNKISHIRLDTIAVEKFELGKISREEKLQIETGLENSEIVLKQYQYDEVTSFNSLNSYLNGAQLDSTIKFVIPAILIPAKINEEEIIELATRNYPQLLRNKINILEAKRNIVQTKTNYGIRANLYGSFGWARGSQQIKDIYTQPFVEEQLSLTVAIPIVNWGSARQANSIAKNQLERAKLMDIQGEADFINNIRTEITFLNHSQQRIISLNEIQQKSEERYNISNERYLLGKISLTDLNLAQQEKDQMKMAYIMALRDYWVSLYELRKLTGYDFINNSPIK